MSTRKAALAVLITGDQKQLERTLNKGGDNLTKFGKKAEHTNTRVGSSFSGLAKRAAAGGAAMVGAYASIAGGKKAIDTTTTLAKTTLSLHKNLGLSIESSSRWAAAAKSRDIDSKALNQSFVVLSKNIGKAGSEQDKYRAKLDELGGSEKDQEQRQKLLAKGAGDTVGAFKKLGISQDELKKSDFDDVLKKAADGLAALPAGADRAALSAKLFGRGWQSIVPVLRGGSKAMDEQLALADKYGVTLKGKTVKSLEEMIAAQRESKFATMGLQVSLGQELIPALTKGSQAFSKFVAQMRTGKGAGGQFADVVETIVDEARPIVVWLGRAGAAVGRFVEKHPEVGKLAAAVIAVGVAVKTLKFVSAATGFTGLLKGGRSAMRGLVRIFATQGAVAGTAAGTAAAGGEGMASSAVFDKHRNTGKRLGKVLGKGIVVGVALGIATAADTITKSLYDKIGAGGTPTGLGQAIWRKLKGDGLGRQIAQNAPTGLGNGALAGAGAGGGGLMGANPALGGFAALGATFGLGVSSGGEASRKNKKTSSGNTSYHSTGEAIDVAGPPAGMLRYFKAMKSRYGGRLAELIYTPGGAGVKNGRPHRYTGQVARDHLDHVHVALDLGRRGPGIGDGIGQATAAARRAGLSGTKLVEAVAIAGPESGYNAEAVNIGPRDHSIGFWQINQLAHKGRFGTDAQLKNPDANARAMKALSSGGKNWQPWTAYTAGSYRSFLSRARAAVIGSRGAGASSSRGGGGGGASAAPDRAEAQERGGSRIINALTRRHSPGINRAVGAAKSAAAQIEDGSTAYGQLERRFGQSEEDLGTAEGRAARGSEIKALRVEKGKQLARAKRRAQHLRTAIKRLDALIKAARKKRDKAKGGTRARIVKRIRDFEDQRSDLAAELKSLELQDIPELGLDIGDLDKEAQDVAGGGAAASSATDKAGSDLELVDLRERAGVYSPGQAEAERQRIRQAALGGAYGALSEREQLQIQGDMLEAQKQATQAVADLTSEITALRAEQAKTNAFNESLIGVQFATISRAFADHLSGELGGRVQARAAMPNSGALMGL